MSNNMSVSHWVGQLKWDDKGLVPVIAQEKGSKDVLMLAWMNREALELTATTGRAVYFSRSRNRLWFKGEESGHVQWVHEMRIDCDQDVLLLLVTQTGHSPGIACHTGRHSCFYQKLVPQTPTLDLHASPSDHALAKPLPGAPEPILSSMSGGTWLSVEPVLKSSQDIYANAKPKE
jgi:phosphoribosyl-AMP cyclohydrolase